MRNLMAQDRFIFLLTILFLLLLPLAKASGSPSDEVVDQWREIKNEEGILVYTQQTPNSQIITAKAVATFDAELETIAQILDDNANQPRWVRYLIESRHIETISPSERLEYNLFAAPWPASDRDFVYRVEALPNASGDGIIFRMKSTSIALMPENEGIIRGDLQESVYKLTREGANLTKVELIFRADPRGWIPLWITNLIQRTWTFVVMKGLRKEIEYRKGN